MAKKVSIDDLNKAKSPEDVKRILQQNGGELSIPDQDMDSVEDEAEESLLVPPAIAAQKAAIAEQKERNALARKTVAPPPNNTGEKARLVGGRAWVDLESGGRFSTPSTVYFSDYSVEDVNNIALSREEDILENIVAILNNAKGDDQSWTVERMLLEEFYESLVAIKYRFNTAIHTHRWMCQCQNEIPEDQRKLSEFDIDLSSLKYRSIEECEEEFRNLRREALNKLSDEDFQSYLIRKYGEDVDVSDITRDDEADNLNIKEPMMVNDGDNVYAFAFARVEDLLKGIRAGQKKFNWKIRQLKNKSLNMSAENLEEQKGRRKEEIDKLEHEKARWSILVTRALSLIGVNGRELETDEEKIEEYSKLKRSTIMKITALQDILSFGIQDEREVVCNLCGHTERRQLQRTISPVELLPLDQSDTSSSGRERKLDAGLDVYFI